MRVFEGGSLSALAGALLIWSIGLAITAAVGLRLGESTDMTAEASITVEAAGKAAMHGVVYAGNSARNSNDSSGAASTN